jgi:hypothetical protein
MKESYCQILRAFQETSLHSMGNRLRFKVMTQQEKLEWEQWIRAVEEVEAVGEDVGKRMRKSDPTRISETFRWIQGDTARIQFWVEGAKEGSRKTQFLLVILRDLRVHLSLVNLRWVPKRLERIDGLLIWQYLLD